MAYALFRFKDFYLDRAAIQNAVRAAGQDPQLLGRAGAMIRSEARRSMPYVKKRTTNSRPGQPPRAHLPARPNLRSVEYFWHSPALQMLVGVPIFPGTRAQINFVPDVHEFGGLISLPRTIRLYKGPKRIRGSGRKAGRKQLAAFRKKLAEEAFFRSLNRNVPTKQIRQTLHYPARPYMWPAAEKIAGKLPNIFGQGIQAQISRYANVTPAVGHDWQTRRSA